MAHKLLWRYGDGSKKEVTIYDSRGHKVRGIWFEISRSQQGHITFLTLACNDCRRVYMVREWIDSMEGRTTLLECYVMTGDR